MAVVYVNGTNLNEKWVKEGYAEVLSIPPSEFDCREWEDELIWDKAYNRKILRKGGFI